LRAEDLAIPRNVLEREKGGTYDFETRMISQLFSRRRSLATTVTFDKAIPTRESKSKEDEYKTD
jgi:hypothetical protein